MHHTYVQWCCQGSTQKYFCSRVDFGVGDCNTMCMEQPERLLPDLTWVKKLAEEATKLANEATASLHTLNEKIDGFREDRVAYIAGAWQAGITVAVVMMFFFLLNLSRRK